MPTRRGTPEVNQMKGFNTVIIDLYYGTLYVLIMGGSTLLPFVNEGTVTEYEKNWQFRKSTHDVKLKREQDLSVSTDWKIY